MNKADLSRAEEVNEAEDISDVEKTENRSHSL